MVALVATAVVAGASLPAAKCALAAKKGDTESSENCIHLPHGKRAFAACIQVAQRNTSSVAQECLGLVTSLMALSP